MKQGERVHTAPRHSVERPAKWAHNPAYFAVSGAPRRQPLCRLEVYPLRHISRDETMQSSEEVLPRNQHPLFRQVKRVANDVQAHSVLRLIVRHGTRPQEVRTDRTGGGQIYIQLVHKTHSDDVVNVHHRPAPQRVLEFPRDRSGHDLERCWGSRPAEYSCHLEVYHVLRQQHGE